MGEFISNDSNGRKTKTGPHGDLKECGENVQDVITEAFERSAA